MKASRRLLGLPLALAACSRTREMRRASVAVAGAVLALAMSTGVGQARVDSPGQPHANHCITHAGVDLNSLFGITEQVITGFCADVGAGEHWRPFGFWIVNRVNETFPAGYVPSGRTPIEDLVAKLVAIRLVVDGGTGQEKTYGLPVSDVLRTDVTADQLEPGFPQLPMAVTLPRIQPLSLGQHTRELVWVLSARHCDGFGSSVQENCLPPGDVSFGVAPFTVITPTRTP